VCKERERRESNPRSVPTASRRPRIPHEGGDAFFAPVHPNPAQPTSLAREIAAVLFATFETRAGLPRGPAGAHAEPIGVARMFRAHCSHVETNGTTASIDRGTASGGFAPSGRRGDEPQDRRGRVRRRPLPRPRSNGFGESQRPRPGTTHRMARPSNSNLTTIRRRPTLAIGGRSCHSRGARSGSALNEARRSRLESLRRCSGSSSESPT
jgi:hypothetical protein